MSEFLSIPDLYKDILRKINIAEKRLKNIKTTIKSLTATPEVTTINKIRVELEMIHVTVNNVRASLRDLQILISTYNLKPP